jgi:multidrug resistance protein EbrB
MKGYAALGVSISIEIFATTMLKVSEGFTVLLPSLAVIIGYAVSFYSFSVCLNSVPLSLAYAIWSGLGTAFTSIIGVVVWGDFFNALTFAGIVLVIGGVILLNGTDQVKKEKEPSM